MTDKPVLLTIRVEDAGEVAPGSLPGNCGRCGALVWLSPSAQRRIKEFEVACLRCVSLEELQGHMGGPLDRDEVASLGLNPDIPSDEIMRLFRRWEARHG